MGESSSTGVLALVVGGPLLAIACASPDVSPLNVAAEPTDPAWVRLYDPSRAANGYNLTLLRQRVPAVLDMNGRVVHSWPEARVKSRVRLLEDGSLLGIALGRGVVEYDWEGQPVWSYVPENGFAHHDVIRLRNGDTLLIVRPEGQPTDDLLAVNRTGKVVWSWRSGEHLATFIGSTEAAQGDVTHLNSVQELPENRWYQEGDRRFRPGNLLISARNLDAVFLIDRDSGAVVWSFETGLDRQHEALMIEPGKPRAGNVLIFNNRFRSFRDDRQSSILEVDPASNSVVWEYRSPGFFTPTSGVEQPLDNGNVLIESTRGERVFEVTRDGETVWEWAPPFNPVRLHRLSYDHSPQLAALPKPAEAAVVAKSGYRHIDSDAYRFARHGSRQERLIDGIELTVLKSNHDCRQLLLPTQPSVEVAFGLDRQRLHAAGRTEYAARFLLRLTDHISGEEVVLVDERLDLSSDEARRQLTVGLEAHSLRPVEICVETEGPSSTASADAASREPGGFAYWQQPAIRSAARGSAEVGSDELPEGVTPEELEAARKHLEAMGYVN